MICTFDFFFFVVFNISMGTREKRRKKGELLCCYVQGAKEFGNGFCQELYIHFSWLLFFLFIFVVVVVFFH